MQGGIREDLYGQRLHGNPPTFNEQSDGAVINFRLNHAPLTSMQLVAAGHPYRTGTRIMAAFMRDGVLIPLQQPVELRFYSLSKYRVVGWPGLKSVVSGTRAVGCFRWLPSSTSSHGDQPVGELAGPSGSADRPDGHGVAAQGCADCSGATDQEFASGLLVFQLESEGDGRHNSSREAAQADEGAQAAAEHGGGSMQRDGRGRGGGTSA
jgi:hypothetical protein